MGGKEEREGKRRGDRDFLSCDFRHIRRGGALISAARAIHCMTGSGAMAWRYARAPLGRNSPFFSHGALARMWSSGAWQGAASKSAISLTFAAMAREHIYRASCRS